MALWRDGTSVGRNAPQLEAETVLGVVASDIDSEITVWDDPMGIGHAANFHPGMAASNQATFNANRAAFSRFVSGGRIAVLRYSVFTQSGNICFAIYANSGSGASARPSGPMLWTSGSFACPASGKATIAVSPSVLVKARQHWIAFVADNTSVSLYVTVAPQQNMDTLEGWGNYKDSFFPLADNPSSFGGNGMFRMPLVTGRRT